MIVMTPLLKISPIATRLCDEIDNNCNDEIDEGVQNTYYIDFDEDGFGDDNNYQKLVPYPMVMLKLVEIVSIMIHSSTQAP